MKKPVFWPFLICFSYWIYLFFTSHMHISCDAIAYESTGRLLQEKGWLEFFKTGPHREPFYPFLVSLSMLIGKHIQTSYHAIITIFQLLILLITQLLTLKILRILKINNLISALVILYLGLSPAIVNSAFSLFSEIAVYPFILSLILLTFYAWKSFNKSKSEVLLLAGASGILFSLTILNKAIFEIIIPLFIISVFLLSLTKRKKKIIINAFIYLLLTGTIFSSIIFAYKHANKEFNGNFVVTGRGDLKLYGTAVRRTQELTGEDFLVALAYIPGEGFCKNIFGQEKCSYWGFEKIDSIGFGKLAQIKSSGKNSEDAAKETIALAIKETIKNPLQYMVFAIMEGAKMLFWESTNIGFVSYPDSLSRIFSYKPFKNALRLFIFILTFTSLFYLLGYLWKRGQVILEDKGSSSEILLVFTLLLIFQFIGIYALFNTVTRYSLPIAPLFLIMIAFFLQKILIKNKN